MSRKKRVEESFTKADGDRYAFTLIEEEATAEFQTYCTSKGIRTVVEHGSVTDDGKRLNKIEFHGDAVDQDHLTRVVSEWAGRDRK